MKTKLLFLSLLFTVFTFSQTLTTYDSGYDSPMVTEFVDSNNMLVLERTNGIKLNNQNDYLVDSQISDFAVLGEGGNLGMTYMQDNGTDYVWIYAIREGENSTRFGSIDRWEVDLDNNTSIYDGNVYQWNTGSVIHYGGTIDIVDGWMFVFLGDNGLAGFAQNDDSYRGKVLRINPFTGEGHPDNPLYDSNDPNSIQSMTFAKGFRNPFRSLVIDVNTVAVFDVGQGRVEECTIVRAGDNGAWNAREGFIWNNPDQTPVDVPNEKLPAFTYTHDFVDFETVNGTINYPFNGRSIIGGAIVNGQYLFFDFFNSEVLLADIQNDIMTGVSNFTFLPESFCLHATVQGNSVFVTAASGNIYEITLDTLNVADARDEVRRIMYYHQKRWLHVPSAVAIYDITGKERIRMRSSGYLTLESGVYIVKSDHETKKIVVG